ncbi:MAG: transposase [Thermoleophilaceae bacterium]
MPRPPREQVAGGVYHVVARGVDRGLIFRDDPDRQRYLDLLGEVIERRGWRVLAYCLMDNHVHLLVETPEPNLAAGMQWLNGHYARYYNDRYDRCGHLFQDRYKAVRQRTDAQKRHRACAMEPGRSQFDCAPASRRQGSVDARLWGGLGEVEAGVRGRLGRLGKAGSRVEAALCPCRDVPAGSEPGSARA